MSEPIVMSGLHNLTLKDYVTDQPIIMFKRIIDISLPGKVDTEAIMGGDIRYAAEAEPKNAKSMGTLGFREWPEELYEYLMNAQVTTGTPEIAGFVSALLAVNGASIINATNGIVSIALDSANTAKLRTGGYTLVATSASAVALYVDTDVDFKRGDVYPTKTGLLTATPITISGSTPISLGYGVQVTPAGIPSFTVGDTVSFYVRSPNVENSSVVVGGADNEGMTFGIYQMVITPSKTTATGEVKRIYLPKVQPCGFDIAGKEYATAQNAPGMDVLFSYTKAMLYKVERTKARLG
jgi:hypothetical protein